MQNYIELPVRFGSLGIPLQPGKYSLKLSDRRGVCMISSDDVANINQHGGAECDFWMHCRRAYGDPLYSFYIGKIVAQRETRQAASQA